MFSLCVHAEDVSSREAGWLVGYRKYTKLALADQALCACSLPQVWLVWPTEVGPASVQTRCSTTEEASRGLCQPQTAALEAEEAWPAPVAMLPTRPPCLDQVIPLIHR
jgi:hypothetical protein